jgi:(2Fe-2S) ferredoxin
MNYSLSIELLTSKLILEVRIMKINRNGIKSLDELSELQKKIEERQKNDDLSNEAKITIAMGTCGIAAGARRVSTAILEELGSRGLNNVKVAYTGCIGLCHQEPVVQVETKGKPAVLYGNLNPELAKKIVIQHVMNKRVINKWVIKEKII